MDITNNLGARIRKLREESNLSQHQLAQYLGIDQSLLSRIEKNERQPSIEIIDKIANLFGCPVENLEAEATCSSSLHFAFRAKDVCDEDMETIAAINRIAFNLREMKVLVGGTVI